MERHATAKTSTVSSARSGASVAAAIRGSLEGQRRQANGLTVVIAQRAVGADELADAMSAGKAVVLKQATCRVSFRAGRQSALRAHVSPAATAVSATAGFNG